MRNMHDLITMHVYPVYTLSHLFIHRARAHTHTHTHTHIHIHTHTHTRTHAHTHTYTGIERLGFTSTIQFHFTAYAKGFVLQTAQLQRHTLTLPPPSHQTTATSNSAHSPTLTLTLTQIQAQSHQVYTFLTHPMQQSTNISLNQ